MTMTSSIPDFIESPATKPRVFRTQLPADLFLQLEAQALKRGVHSFKLAEFVITAWLRGELVSRPPASQTPSPLEPEQEGAKQPAQEARGNPAGRRPNQQAERAGKRDMKGKVPKG